ncbi:MAG TPA: amidohydrolase [Hyphomicrobiales bacterium]|nr:amidohydrolase [Hyphomicrobiales bacterium]
MRTTLVGCIALLGPEARVSDGPVDIVIEDKTILDIRPHGVAESEGQTLDMRKRLVAPGLINGHVHSHEGFSKGRTDNVPLELWMNTVRPLKPLPLTPRDVYLRTMVAAIEAVKSGTTTICDDLNVSPAIRRDHVEAAYQAYDDVGIRAYVGMSLFDRPFFRAVPFVEEEFPRELLAELDAAPMYSSQELLNYARELAETKHPSTQRVGFIAAPSAPQRCTEGFLKQVRSLADELDLPVMIHVQETRLQVVTGQVWHGCTMVEYLDRLGFLKPKTQLIHGVWLNPREIDLIARSGASLQHNPTSNLKLGSGIAPVRAILDAGINLSMGSDGCGSIETNDMQTALQLGALINKMRGDYPSWIGAKESFQAATAGGAKALGRERDLGAIEKGRAADLVAYRLDSIAFSPLNDPLRQMVFSATKADIDLVMVDGEIVQRDGRLTRVDEDKLLAEIAEVHARVEPLLDENDRLVERLLVPYRRIYERCQHIPIAPDTHPARL